MDIGTWLTSSSGLETDATLAEVNKRLSVGGMSISVEDARMLSERRAEALSDTERVEFGQPAIVAIAEAVATAPCLSQNDVAQNLAELQDAFYAIRDELPAIIPDAEITEALRGCLDEWGDATLVASMSTKEIMGFSAEYARAAEAESTGEYRIVDDEGRAYVFGGAGRDCDEGRAYTFDATEWDYDEQADGWDKEGWADDWND